MMDTSVMQERIGQLCGQFELPTVAAETVARFTAAGHGDALATFLEVLEQEAEDRKQRRINRLRRESRLPSGKTWETFWWKPATPSSSPRPTAWCRNSSSPSATWTCPGDCASWTTATSCSSTTWATCPRAPRSPRSSSHSSPNATNGGPWASVKPGLLGVGTHLRQPHGHRRGHRPGGPPLRNPGV